MKTGFIAVLSAVIFLGFSVPASAHECDRKPGHKHCDDPTPPEPPGDPSATFKVEVFIGGALVGTAYTAEGKTAGQRRKVSDPGLTLDLTVFDSLACTIGSMGLPEAQFALSTYRNKKTQLFTFVTATFWNFPINTNGVDYALFFAPEADGNVSNGSNWLPSSGTTTSVTGEKVSLSSQTAANADDPCYMDKDISWQINVTGN